VRIRALDAIGIDWRDGEKREENPNYIILKEYHEAGGDINLLGNSQSLRKLEDGMWEIFPEKKGVGRWLAAQRTEKKRGISDVRIRALDAIGIDWRDGA